MLYISCCRGPSRSPQFCWVVRSPTLTCTKMPPRRSTQSRFLPAPNDTASVSPLPLMPSRVAISYGSAYGHAPAQDGTLRQNSHISKNLDGQVEQRRSRGRSRPKSPVIKAGDTQIQGRLLSLLLYHQISSTYIYH